MTKKTEHGHTTWVVKVPTYTPPIIVDEFRDDNDELNYVLANGNTTLAVRYNSLWNPKPSPVQWQSKGTAIQGKQQKH